MNLVGYHFTSKERKFEIHEPCNGLSELRESVSSHSKCHQKFPKGNKQAGNSFAVII